MKEGIHPEYNQTTITCACGNVLEVGSTKKDIKVDVCSKCHPYWTRKHKTRQNWRKSRKIQKQIWTIITKKSLRLFFYFFKKLCNNKIK